MSLVGLKMEPNLEIEAKIRHLSGLNPVQIHEAFMKYVSICVKYWTVWYRTRATYGLTLLTRLLSCGTGNSVRSSRKARLVMLLSDAVWLSSIGTHARSAAGRTVPISLRDLQRSE